MLSCFKVQLSIILLYHTIVSMDVNPIRSEGVGGGLVRAKVVVFFVKKLPKLNIQSVIASD